MANEKPNIKKTVGRINSKWMQNAVKSMGLAGTAVIKDIFPATTAAISSTSSLAKESIKAAQGATKDANSIRKTINSFSGVQMAKQVVENSLEDLKSGNLYNERDPFASQGFSDDNVDDMFGDIDEMYGGEDSGDDSAPDVQINNQVINREDDGSYNATISVLNKNTEHQLKASKAQIDAMVSISSMQMAKSAEIGTKVIDALDAINNNIAALIEFNTENMSKLISSSISFYEQMGLKEDNNYSGGNGDITTEDIFDDGKFNAEAYMKFVKKNISNSLVLNMLGMVTENKDMISSNPIGAVLKAGIEGMIPNIAKQAMKGFDKTVENFIPNMLERLSEFGSKADTDTVGGMIRSVVGNFFGIKTNRSNKIDPKRVDATPIPWNGIANHSVIEVIPKYLRESTGYLQEIAEAITGKTKDDMSDKFIGYNWETGQYQSVNERRNEIADQFIANTYDTMSKTRLFGAIDEMIAYLTEKEPDLAKQMQDAKTELAVRIDQHKGPIDWKNEDDRKGLLNSVTGANDRTKSAYEGIMLRDLEKQDGMLAEVDAAKRKVARDRNQLIKNISDDPTVSGAHQVINGRSVDDWENDRINAQLANDGKITISAAPAKVSIPTVLNEINNVLHRGLYVVVKDKFPGSSDNTGGEKRKAEVEHPASIKGDGDNPMLSNAHTAEDFSGVYDYVHQEAQEANVDYEPDKGQLGSTTARIFNGMSRVLNGIMQGDADKAFDDVINVISDQFSSVGHMISEKFLLPIKTELFGEKDEKTGYRSNGLFAGVNNKLRESYFSLRQMITGEGYIDSNGEKVAPLTGDDAKNTVKYKLTNMIHSIRTGIETRLFGEKGEDGEEGGKEGLIKKATNGISYAANSLKLGLNGWRHALFGGSDKDDEDPLKSGEETWKAIKEKASEVLPSALAGSVMGAGGGLMAGGILGTLVGGPVGGALLGFAGGLASQSEKFKNWLFGKEDEDGNRVGGLIKSDTQKFFKDHAAFLTGGAALGAIKGGITGGGVLGTLVGGPVAGALMGLGTAMVVKSNMFQKFLFGDAESGQLGIVTLGKQWLRTMSSDKDSNGIDGSKLLGMTGIGTAAGGFLGTLVGGPILGASLGLGASILAQKDNFHAWLFGEDDPKTGAHREGIFGQMRNALQVSVFDPMKHRMEETVADAKRFLYYDVLAKFNIAIEPIGDAVANTLSNVSAALWDTTRSVGKFIKEDFLGGMVSATREVLAPVTQAASAVGSAIWTAAKGVIAAPVNILYAITSPIAQATGKVIGATVSAITKPIGAAVKTTFAVFSKSLGIAAKTIGKAVSLPFKLVSNTVNFINDKVITTITHVGRATEKVITDIAGGVWKIIYDHGPIGWIRKRWDNAKKFFGDIKEGLTDKLAPVKDAMVSAIHYVRDTITNHIRDSIKSFFSMLNPLNWIKKIGKMIGIGKKDKDKEGKPKEYRGIGGYFRKVWDDTKYGKPPVDLTNHMVIDEETGEVIGRKKGFTRGMADRQGRIARNQIQKNKNKEIAKQNRDHDYNQKQIARILKNQKVTDTEENRMLAQLEYQRKHGGESIKFRGEALKPETVRKTEQFQDRSINVQEDTNKTLHNIKETLNFIMGRTHKESLWDTRTDQYNAGQVEGNLIGKRYRARKEMKNNIETDYDDRQYKRIQRYIKEARKRESAARQENYDEVLNEWGYSDGMKIINSNLRGIRRGMRKGRKGKDVNIPGHAKGTDNAEPGLALVGEEGPELKVMKGGEKIIPNGDIMGVFSTMLKTLTSIRDHIRDGFDKLYDVTDDVKDATDSVAATVKPVEPIAMIPEHTSASAQIAKPEEAKDEKKKPKVKFNGARGITAEERKAKQKEEDKENEEKKLSEYIRETMDDIKGGVFSHNTVWNSIFSKKGIITGSLILAAPLIWKLIKMLPDAIKNLVNVFGNFVGRTAEDVAYGNDRLGDGRSTLDVVGDEVNGLAETGKSLAKGDLIGAVKNFVYDKDGQVYNETGAREKLLAKSAAKTGQFFIKNGSIIGKGLKYGYTAATAGKAAAKGLGKELGASVAKAGADDVAKASSKLSTSVGKLAGTTVDVVSKAAEKSGVTSLINTVKNFITTIATKASAKFGTKIQASAFGKILNTVTGVIQKGYSKIAPKISAILSGAATLGSTVIGFAAKESTWVTLGAINGLSGAKRLFRTDDYWDWKMVAISALFGALGGTTVGSILDCINELVVSTIGVDMFTECATALYQMVSNDDDLKTLEDAQDALKDSYDADVDADLKKQYQTMVQTGLIDPDTMDEDTWVNGAKSGDVHANIQSFADYNDEQNQTLMSRAAKAVKGSTVVKALGNAKNALFGYTEEEFESMSNPDIVYRKNDNGTFSAFNRTTGEQVGEGELDRQTLMDAGWQNPTIEHQGAIKKAWTGVKDFGRNTVTAAKNGLNTVGSKLSDSWNSLGNTVSGWKNSAGQFFNNIGDSIASSVTDAVSGFNAGIQQISANFDNKDVDFLQYATADVNTVKEDNPLHGIVGAGLGLGKVAVFGSKVFGKLFNVIGEKISGIVDSVKTAGTSLTTGVNELFSKAIGGDLMGFLTYSPNIGDGILNGIVKTAIHAAKLPSFIVAAVSALGHSLAGPITSIIDTGKTMWSAYTDGIASHNEFITNGDPAGLLASDYKVEDGTPFSGLLNFGIAVDKYANIIPASAMWLGKKIGDGATSLVESGKEAIDIISDSTSDLMDAAVSGDADKFNDVGSEIGDDHKIAGGIVTTAKVLASPIVAISHFGHLVVDKVKDIFSTGKNVVKDVKSYAATLSDYTDTNKDMSGFFNEKINNYDKNPVYTVIQAVVSGVMNMYVSLVRSVKGIAESIKEKVNGIGTWIMDLIRGEGDDVNEGIDDAASGRGGKGGRSGGLGIAPSTLNGGTYYSQNDIRWGNRSYTEANGNDASATMSDSGCGPTAMAMALNDVKGNAPDPTTLAHLAQRTGDRDETGTNANFISNAANAYGVTANETDNPSAGSIVSKIQSSGNPVVLLGQSYGNGPYTSSGHYLVAEGTDASGNIIINDPRGVEYSGAVAPESLSGTTSAAWSFENASQNGGIGGRGFRKNLHRIANVVGGYGDRDKWLNIVAEVKYQIAKTQEGYSQQKSTPVTIGGKTLKVRRDCSGLVSACLQFYGVLSEGVKLTSYSISDKTNSYMVKTGFTPASFKNWTSLSSGDIVARPGHTEIYATTNNGTTYVYNVGSDSSANNPYATLPAEGTHVTVWKVGKAGPNCVTAPKHDIQFDKNYKGDKITGSDSDSGSTSFFSKITGAFSAVANALFESAVTGESPDWNKVVNDYTSEYTSSGSDDTSADYDSDTISGDASEYNASIITGNKGMTTTGGDSTRGTIWKSLRSFGLNKEGAAGLMGAWTAESTLRPNNLEDYYNKLYGITDTQYTNYVDANNKWPDKKEHNVGYGLAQWTGANGNTQSGSKRKDGLLSLAKSTGASVGNLGVQLQYAETELKNNYPKAYKHLQNAPNVESAVKSALGEYEMPGWGMEVAAAKSTYFNPRLKYAKEILAKYKNSRDNFTSGGRGSLKKAIGDAATEAAGDFLTNQIDNYMDAAYEKYTGNKVDKDARKKRRAEYAAQQKLEEENKKKQQEAAAKKAAEKKKPKKQQAADAFAQVVTDAVIAPLVDEGVKQGKKYIENKIGYNQVDGVAGASAKAPVNKKNGKGGRGSFDFSQIGDIMTSVFGEDTLRQAGSMAKDLALDMASDTVKNNRSDIDQALKDGATKANGGVNTAAAKLDEMFPGLGYGDSVKAAWADMLTTNMPTINSTLDAVAARDQSAVTSRNLYSEAMNAYGAKDYQDLYSILSDPYGTLMSAASESGASLNQNTYAPVVSATDTATQQVTSGAISGGITTTTSTPQKVEVVNQYQQQAKSESSETTTQIVSIMGKIVDILDNIAASSDNLSELKNIKDGIANIHIPTVTTSGGSGNGSSNQTTTKKPSLKIPFSSSSAADRYGNDGISNNEYTARRIAFGR